MKITELRQNVFFCDAPGPASNVVYLRMAAGILLIDTTTSVENIQKVIDQAGITPNEIIALVNTHADGDHIGGNSLFSCRKYAHQSTYDRMEEAGLSREEMPSHTFENPRRTLPTGDFELEMIHTGGHKPDQTMLWLPKLKVLIASDLLFQGRYPFMQNCDVHTWVAALKSFRDFDAEVILPGHGTVCTYADVDELLDYMETSLAIAAAHKEKGTPLADVQRDPAFPRPSDWEREQLAAPNIEEFFNQA